MGGIFRKTCSPGKICIRRHSQIRFCSSPHPRNRFCVLLTHHTTIRPSPACACCRSPSYRWEACCMRFSPREGCSHRVFSSAPLLKAPCSHKKKAPPRKTERRARTITKNYDGASLGRSEIQWLAIIYNSAQAQIQRPRMSTHTAMAYDWSESEATSDVGLAMESSRKPQ